MKFNTYLTKDEWLEKNELIKKLHETNEDNPEKVKRSIELINSLCTSSEKKLDFFKDSLSKLHPDSGDWYSLGKDRLLWLNTQLEDILIDRNDFNILTRIMDGNGNGFNDTGMTFLAYLDDIYGKVKNNNPRNDNQSNTTYFNLYHESLIFILNTINSYNIEISDIVNVIEKKSKLSTPVSLNAAHKDLKDNIVNLDALLNRIINNNNNKSGKTFPDRKFHDKAVIDNIEISIININNAKAVLIDEMNNIVNTSVLPSGTTIAKLNEADNNSRRETMLKTLKNPIIDLLWEWENRQHDVQLPEEEKYTFRILSNGNVEVLENKKVKATALNTVTTTNDDYTKCITNRCKFIHGLTMGHHDSDKDGALSILLSTLAPNGFWYGIDEEEKIANAYTILKNAQWVLKYTENPNEPKRVAKFSDLTANQCKKGEHVHKIMLKLGFSEPNIINRNFSFNNNYTKLIEECVDILNKHPDILNINDVQTFTTKPKKINRYRLTREQALELQKQEMKSPLRNIMYGGAKYGYGNILTGNSLNGNKSNMIGGHVGGYNNHISCADTYGQRLNMLSSILRSRNKRLDDHSERALQNKITLVKNLEAELNELIEKISNYVKFNGDNNRGSVSLDDMNNVTKLSSQLTKNVIVLSNGLFKLTGHIQGALPTNDKASYTTL